MPGSRPRRHLALPEVPEGLRGPDRGPSRELVVAPDLVGRQPLLPGPVPALELVLVQEPPEVVLQPPAGDAVEGPQEGLDPVVR